jgi:hypothetical protein
MPPQINRHSGDEATNRVPTKAVISIRESDKVTDGGFFFFFGEASKQPI